MLIIPRINTTKKEVISLKVSKISLINALVDLNSLKHDIILSQTIPLRQANISRVI